MLSAIGKWTEFVITVDVHTIVLRVTRIAPLSILYKFAFRYLWIVDGTTVKNTVYQSYSLRDNAIGGYVVLCANGDLTAKSRLYTESATLAEQTWSASGVTAGVIGLSVQQPDDDDGTGFDILIIGKYNNFGYYYSGECNCGV